MSRRLLLLVIVAGCSTIEDPVFVAIDGATPPAPDATPLAPTLESLWQNVFRPKCFGPCHGGPTAPAGFDMKRDTLHTALLAPVAGEGGNDCAGSGLVRVAPNDPDNSVLYSKVAAKAGLDTPLCGGPMPDGDTRPPLTTEELDALRLWILDGANDD
jgi:hypothetical protein